MSELVEFFHLLARLFEHLVGDPVHAQSAAALQTTVKAVGSLLGSGMESTDAFEELHDKVESMLSTGRAVTPEEWGELHEMAKTHLVASETHADSINP